MNLQATPFAAYDVLFVHVVAALPLAIVVVRLALEHWTIARCQMLGAFCLLGGVLSIALGRAEIIPLPGFALRTVFAVMLVEGAVLCAARFVNRIPLDTHTRSSWQWTVLLAALLLPLATSTYESARCQSDRIRLSECAEQSRMREAQVVARRLLTLQPNSELQGRSIAAISKNLEKTITVLEERVSQPLPPRATSRQTIARARDLAMLGENAAAVDVLAMLPNLKLSPAACNLLGTIGENERTWQEAAQWYRQARELTSTSRDSKQASAELVRATTGLAYCQRKQGDIAAAEQTYEELVSLAPSADNYFVLAQFYEETQQVTKAQTCARKAMALAPERYQIEGQRLIDKLITLHFGCLRAYTANAE